MFSRLDRRFAESARSTGINLICFLSDLCLRPFFFAICLDTFTSAVGGGGTTKRKSLISSPCRLSTANRGAPACRWRKSEEMRTSHRKGKAERTQKEMESQKFRVVGLRTSKSLTAAAAASSYFCNLRYYILHLIFLGGL